METLVKKYKFAVVIIAIVLLFLLVWAFRQDTYSSMRDDEVYKPPFKDTYFGMTVDEFCEAVKIDKSELREAAPFDSAQYFDLEHIMKTYGRTEDEIRIYENYDNQYYFSCTGAIYGLDNYFIDDQPQSVRLIFTNETTYNGKTIPPLLCAVFVNYSTEEKSFAISNVIQAAKAGKIECPKPEQLHKKAQLLSYMYAAGMSPTEIEALNVPQMDSEEVNRYLRELVTAVPLVIVEPNARIHTTFLLDNAMTKKISQFAVADAPYLAYYDWFLNELT